MIHVTRGLWPFLWNICWYFWCSFPKLIFPKDLVGSKQPLRGELFRGQAWLLEVQFCSPSS
eukprot:m.62484 g.62484  ORF g.62484 m.62484 type:complete len:61 (+) comp35070_c1_seq10:1255-1437(+)